LQDSNKILPFYNTAWPSCKRLSWESWAIPDWVPWSNHSTDNRFTDQYPWSSWTSLERTTCRFCLSRLAERRFVSSYTISGG